MFLPWGKSSWRKFNEEQVALAASVREQGTWQPCVPSTWCFSKYPGIYWILLTLKPKSYDVASCTVVQLCFWLLALAFYQWLFKAHWSHNSLPVNEPNFWSLSLSRTGTWANKSRRIYIKETDVENMGRMWSYDMIDMMGCDSWQKVWFMILTYIDWIKLHLENRLIVFVAASGAISALARHWKNSAGFRCRCWSHWAKDMSQSEVPLRSHRCGILAVSKN